MALTISFKQMESSPALEQYAFDALTHRISKYIAKNYNAQLTLEVDRQVHIAKCHLHADSRFDVQMEQRGANMYAVIDMLAHRLENSLRRIKEKRKAHKPRQKLVASTPITFVPPEQDRDWVDGADIVAFERAMQRKPISLMLHRS